MYQLVAAQEDVYFPLLGREQMLERQAYPYVSMVPAIKSLNLFKHSVRIELAPDSGVNSMFDLEYLLLEYSNFPNSKSLHIL